MKELAMSDARTDEEWSLRHNANYWGCSLEQARQAQKILGMNMKEWPSGLLKAVNAAAARPGGVSGDGVAYAVAKWVVAASGIWR